MRCEGSGGFSITHLSLLSAPSLSFLSKVFHQSKRFCQMNLIFFSFCKSFLCFAFCQMEILRRIVFLFKPQQFSLKLTFPSLFSNPNNVIFMTKA